MGIWQEPGRLVMMALGGLLICLGIKKEYEPTLLVPMGLGAILVNFPNSGVLNTGGEAGPFQVLYDIGIKTELFPLLLFIGIGAMIDFGPRSEEHTSELQSRFDLVCRLLLEKQKNR